MEIYISDIYCCLYDAVNDTNAGMIAVLTHFCCNTFRNSVFQNVNKLCKKCNGLLNNYWSLKIKETYCDLYICIDIYLAIRIKFNYLSFITRSIVLSGLYNHSFYNKSESY